jgi:hypothetical protein
MHKTYFKRNCLWYTFVSQCLKEESRKINECGSILMTWHATIFIRQLPWPRIDLRHITQHLHSAVPQWLDPQHTNCSLSWAPSQRHTFIATLIPLPSRFMVFPDALYHTTLMEHFTFSLYTGLWDKMLYRFGFYESFFAQSAHFISITVLEHVMSLPTIRH